MGGPLGTSLVACGMIADTRQGKNDEKEIEGGGEGGGDDARSKSGERSERGDLREKWKMRGKGKKKESEEFRMVNSSR